MITAAFYTATTGDDEPGDGFADDVAAIVARFETALNRPIPHAERTEWVNAWKLAHPSATPITDAGDWPHTDISVAVGAVGRIQITYTGGWLAQDAEPVDGAETIPHALAVAIAWALWTARHPAPTTTGDVLPADVHSMSVAGEFTITRRAAAVGADGEEMPGGWDGFTDLGGKAARFAAPFRRIPLSV